MFSAYVLSASYIQGTPNFVCTCINKEYLNLGARHVDTLWQSFISYIFEHFGFVSISV